MPNNYRSSQQNIAKLVRRSDWYEIKPKLSSTTEKNMKSAGMADVWTPIWKQFARFSIFSQRELAPSWVESWRSHLSTTHLSLANSRLLLWTPVCWLFTIQNHIIIHVAHVSCWLCKVWNWFHSCYWKSFRQIYMIQIELYKKIHMEIPEKNPLKFPIKFPNPYPVRGKRRAGKSPLWFCWFGRCWENHRTIAGGIFISHGNDDTRGCF